MDQTSNSTLCSSPAHVLIFPFPFQGHVNSMLKLAEVLSIEGLQVTFVNTEYIHKCLTCFTDIQTRFLKYPGFQFRVLPDSLPTDHSTDVVDLFESMRLITKPVFKQMLADIRPPVTCVIGDGILGFVTETALEIGAPIIHFRTISACCFWAYFCVPDIIEAGELPIKGEEDMDRLITKVAGMEAFLRCRDLPYLCRTNDIEKLKLRFAIVETRRSTQVQALILNTFEELDAPILSQIRKHIPKVYTVGPLHELLKTKLRSTDKQELYQSSNSLQEVDENCISWLDSQPPSSVIYVSFGSTTKMEKEQFLEFWHGIINSKKKFLWVIRPDSITSRDDDSKRFHEELQEGSKECGYIVKWAPQEEVLMHKAVGGFLTHSGWNSTIESIVAGVPMICWPYFYDQQLNSRFVSEVWKVGLDMKDVCDRKIVEKMINDVLVDRRDEFVKTSDRIAKLARDSVQEHGCSSFNLKCLIEDIKKIRMQAPNDIDK